MKLSITVALVATSIALSAQQNNDTKLTLDAQQEGYDSAQTAALFSYWLNKTSNEPSQRNANPGQVQTIVNPGFESGNFTGWSGFIGDNMTGGVGAPLSNLQAGIFSTTIDAPITDVNARHTIVTDSLGNDPYGGFPIVPASLGTYAVRMGGETPNYQGEQLEQAWMVDAGQPYVLLNYAVVLDAPPTGHATYAQSYFQYLVLDSNNDTIAYKQIISIDTTLMVSGLTSPAGAPVNYQPWVTDSIALTAYVGQAVKVQFTVAGCIQSGHFGYCYIDTFYPYIASVTEASEPQFSFEPNPTTGLMNLHLLNAQAAVVNIYTVTGQFVQTTNVNAVNTTLNFEGLEPGVYILEVVSEQERSSRRIVIE